MSAKSAGMYSLINTFIMNVLSENGIVFGWMDVIL